MPPQQRSHMNEHNGDMSSSGEILSRPPPRRSAESMDSQSSYGGRGYDDRNHDDDDHRDDKSEVSLRTANTRAIIQSNSFIPEQSGPYKTLPQSIPIRGGPPAQSTNPSAYPQKPRVETDYYQNSNQGPVSSTRNTDALPAGYARPSAQYNTDDYGKVRPSQGASSSSRSGQQRREDWDAYQANPSSPAPSTVTPSRPARPREPPGRTANRPRYGEVSPTAYGDERGAPPASAQHLYKEERSDKGERRNTQPAIPRGPPPTEYRENRAGSRSQLDTRAPPPPPTIQRPRYEDERPRTDDHRQDSRPPLSRDEYRGDVPVSRSRRDDRSTEPPPPPPSAGRQEYAQDMYSQPPSRLAPPSPMTSQARSSQYVEMPRAGDYQRSPASPNSPAPVTAQSSYDDRSARATSRHQPSRPEYPPAERDAYIQPVSNAGTGYGDKPSRRESRVPSPTTGTKPIDMPKMPNRLSATGYGSYDYKNSPGYGTPSTTVRSPLSQMPMNQGDDYQQERDRAPRPNLQEGRASTYLSPHVQTFRQSGPGDYFSGAQLPHRERPNAQYDGYVKGEEDEVYTEAVPERKRQIRAPASPMGDYAITELRPGLPSRIPSSYRSGSTASTARRDDLDRKETEVEQKLARLRAESARAERARRQRLEEWRTVMDGRLKQEREKLQSNLSSMFKDDPQIKENVKYWKWDPETAGQVHKSETTALVLAFTDGYNTIIKDTVNDYFNRQDDGTPSDVVQWSATVKWRHGDEKKGSVEAEGFRVISSFDANIAGTQLNRQVRSLFDSRRPSQNALASDVFVPTIGITSRGSRRLEEEDDRRRRRDRADEAGSKKQITQGVRSEEERRRSNRERDQRDDGRSKQKQITEGSKGRSRSRRRADGSKRDEDDERRRRRK